MSKRFSSNATLISICLFLALERVAQAQSDVTQPGDPIFASSSFSPGSEGVANAIDNTQAKYLNFDTSTGHNPPNAPSGFAVTPSVGVTRVVGMTIQSANDEPIRDPDTIVLEGSNDNQIGGYNDPTNTWTFIVGLTNIPPFTARFQTQTFFFDNFQPYKHYRWTVLAVATPNSCCMQVAEVELLGSTLPPDVTQPGDPIIASSSFSPGSEGVANAIDNTQAKYLNFDTSTGHTPPNAPSGFVVTPSIGSSLVTGMTIQSANDEPIRDPSTVTLEGSNDAMVGGWNDPTNTWTFIAGVTNIPAFTARFETQTFLFDNFTPYKHYRWTVLEVATPNSCCMQVAEVQLLGTGAPKDVTQPGDPLIASSSFSPGSEGVANAIDNTQAKYLNFDTSTGHTPPNAPSGFVVTPSIGATVVTGMTIQSANDEPIRDPSTITLEGSNDATIGGWNDPTNTWEFIVGLTNIPAFTARFETQEFYFPNKQSFKHYRWTVLAVATPNSCCMQVAEVELLAATQSNPCGQTAFVQQPVNTPALAGTPATFITKVNGPWTLQWYANGLPIPGATKNTYSTPPVDAKIVTNLYSCAIVGCQTSSVVQASIFIPSATKSIAVNFSGQGANGAPSFMPTNDIAGVQLQAFWNNATNDPASGSTGDLTTMADSLTDSDGNTSTITFEFASNGAWGAGTASGTASDSPTDRMLNGLVGTANSGAAAPSTFTFHKVPAGTHSILVYAVSPPLQFQTASYAITAGTPTPATIYIRVLNSDEYKPAPGFYRGTSTSVVNPTIGDFVRFDGISPDASGDITLTVDTVVGAAQETGVNGLQLVLNAPNPGSPPAITQNPQATVAALGGTATVSVTASGNNLTYQWRKNGVSLSNGGHVSGATTSTLTISSFTNADEGVYSVAVFNPAGSVISKNASVRASKYDIMDSLVGYWRLDEISGLTAANSAAGGQVGVVNGAAAWVSGQISNAFSFDGATYLYVSNYSKASVSIGASGWVKVNPAIATSVNFIRNGNGDLQAGQVGQFELGLVQDAVDASIYHLHGAIQTGPNVVNATASGTFTLGSWQYVALSADGAQLHLYVNGVEVAATDYLGPIATPQLPYLAIGAVLATDLTDPLNPVTGPDGTNPNFMNGAIDDLGLWTRSLTSEEVSKIYAAGLLHQALTTVTEIAPSNPPVFAAPTFTAGSINITWSNGGTLETAPTVTGPWTSTGNTSGTFSEVVGAGNKFYRVNR